MFRFIMARSIAISCPSSPRDRLTSLLRRSAYGLVAYTVEIKTMKLLINIYKLLELMISNETTIF